MTVKEKKAKGVDLETLFKSGHIAVFENGERIKDIKKLPGQWEKIARGHMTKPGEGGEIVQDAKACVIRFVSGKATESESLDAPID